MTDKKTKLVAWADNPEEAERLHGPEREECMNRLGPTDDRWHGARADLSRICWEFGWDSAASKLYGLTATQTIGEVRSLFNRVRELEAEVGKTCGCGWTGDKEYRECEDHAAVRLERDELKARLEAVRGIVLEVLDTVRRSDGSSEHNGIATGSTRYYHGDDCPFVEEDIGDHGETERLWCRVDGKSCTRGGICGPALIRQRDEARREVCAILSIEAGSDRQTMLDLASERGWSYLYCAPAPVIP